MLTTSTLSAELAAPAAQELYQATAAPVQVAEAVDRLVLPRACSLKPPPAIWKSTAEPVEAADRAGPRPEMAAWEQAAETEPLSRSFLARQRLTVSPPA